MANRKFSPAQLRAQRAFAARARARSRGVRRSRSTRRTSRVSTPRSTMARRTRRTSARRSRGSRKSKASWADLAADANIAFQLAEPMLPAVAAAMKGDAAGAMAAGRAGIKEAIAPKNLVEAAGPKVGLGLAKKALSFFGVRSRHKFGGRKVL